MAVASTGGVARLSIAELRMAASGRWPELLATLGFPAESLTQQNKPCPACGGQDRFSFMDKRGSGSFVCRAMERQGGDGFELVMHFLGCDLRGALAAVAEALGGVAYSRPPCSNVQPGKRPVLDDGEALRNLWRAALPVVDGDPVSLYLAKRGVMPAVMPLALRCHPALAYWQTGGARPVRLGAFPAMLAAVQGGDGVTVAIHRTYLDVQGGKLRLHDPVSGEALPAKKLKTRRDGVMPGAAVRLFSPVGGRLVVTEGIETALAVYQITGVPVWACVSAAGLASVVLPSDVQEVFIAADNDPNGAGQRAARVLEERLKHEGRAGCVLFPSTPGLDWLDVLNAERSPA